MDSMIASAVRREDIRLSRIFESRPCPKKMTEGKRASRYTQKLRLEKNTRPSCRRAMVQTCLRRNAVLIGRLQSGTHTERPCFRRPPPRFRPYGRRARSALERAKIHA